jgi:hypothetical protein
MNIKEFREKHKKVSSQHKIKMRCDICGNEGWISKGGAERNILRNRHYIDRSCAMTSVVKIGLDLVKKSKI